MVSLDSLSEAERLRQERLPGALKMLAGVYIIGSELLRNGGCDDQASPHWRLYCTFAKDVQLAVDATDTEDTTSVGTGETERTLSVVPSVVAL